MSTRYCLAYLCLPAGSGKAPVVITMHERYGYVKHPRDVAERFAREGFVGLAPNMFYKPPTRQRSTGVLNTMT